MTGEQPSTLKWIEPARVTPKLEPRVRMSNWLFVGLFVVAIFSAMFSCSWESMGDIPMQGLLLYGLVLGGAVILIVVPRIWPRRACFIHDGGLGRNANWSWLAMRYWKWDKVSQLTISTVQIRHESYPVLDIYNVQGKVIGRLGLSPQVNTRVIAVWADARNKPLRIESEIAG